VLCNKNARLFRNVVLSSFKPLILLMWGAIAKNMLQAAALFSLPRRTSEVLDFGLRFERCSAGCFGQTP
jgi:hypothetical protein